MTGSLLITGSRGFIGSFVLQALQQAVPQQQLLLAGRQAPGAAGLAAVQHLPLDLADGPPPLPTGVHTVLHLAGEKRDAARMAAVNHRGTVQLVDAAARAGAQRFVHLSSVGVYGAGHRAGLVDIHTPHQPRGPYETSKDAGEQGVIARCAALGLRCVVLQPSNVIALVPGQSRPLLGLVRSVARGWFRLVGAQPTWVNYIAAEDVAAAIVAAVLNPGAAGTLILNTPAPLQQLVGWIADELAVPPPQSRLPLWLATAAAGLGAAAGALLQRDLPISPARLRELSNTTRFEGDAAPSALGFAYPQGIEATVRRLVRQYRAERLV